MIHGSDFHLTGDEDIRCVHGETAETPRGYPVLTVMPPGRLTGGLTIWPGLDGLRRLRAAIDGYLAEHEPTSSICDHQINPAMQAVTEWDGQDDDDLVLLLAEKFGRTIRGSDRITVPADQKDIPDRPVPAEAATTDDWHAYSIDGREASR